MHVVIELVVPGLLFFACASSLTCQFEELTELDLFGLNLGRIDGHIAAEGLLLASYELTLCFEHTGVG